MLRKVICCVFTVYELSSGSSRILLQGPPVEIPVPLPPIPPIPPVGPQTPPIEPPVVDPITPPITPPIVPPPQIPIDPLPPVPIDPVPIDPVPIDPVGQDPAVQVLPPDGYRFGAFGQLCPLTPASLFNKCQQPNDMVHDPTAVWCDRDGDCCMCQEIECGPNCNRFYAGDSSVYGVENIIINGQPLGNGALIDCHGVEACRGATINGEHIDAVDCNGDRSCQGTTMYLIDPKPGFLLDCAGIAACDGLHISIEFSGPPPNYMCDPQFLDNKNIFQLSGVDCANNIACQNMDVTINNKGCDKVILQNVECVQPGSCNGARFNLIGDIDIQNCQCGPSCSNALGLAKCFQNLDRLLCPDPQACMAQKKEIINPSNGFEFICGNEESCKDAIFTISLDQDITKPQPITHLKGIILGGLNAAKGATFIFNNQQGTDEITQIPIILELQRVECGGYGSCEDMTIITGQNMFIDSIVCASEACYGCTVKVNEADPMGRPCDPSQLIRPTPQPTPVPPPPVPVVVAPNNPPVPPNNPINPPLPIEPIPVQPVVNPIPPQPLPVVPAPPQQPPQPPQWVPIPIPLPMDPVPPQPVIPAQPAIPALPVDPVVPEPAIPAQPVDPVVPEPALPAIPALPVQPIPAQPVDPIQPQPVDPIQPQFVPIPQNPAGPI